MTYGVTLPERGTFAAWREAARRAISHRISPGRIDWSGGRDLFAVSPLPDHTGAHEARVPQAFLKLAGSVIWHAAPERFALLYQALWRLDLREGNPLSQADPLGRRLDLMARAVGRDIHKMHAFVRFHELPSAGARRSFAAWFEPEHNTLEPGSAFFARRFADMDWLIATPELTARFEAGHLAFGPGSARPDLPEDASQTLWATYFANIFNPARIKLDAMRAEMPKKYWKNLPETRLIPDMLADAEARVERMREAGASRPRAGAAPVSTRYRAAMPQAPELPGTLEEARAAALQCRRCPLVAELLPAVVRAAAQFDGNYGAASDPKLDIRLRDGRRELLRSDERYDLITLEPPPPAAAGVVNLYSRDFYAQAIERLERNGIFAQWLPLHTQNGEETQSLVRSFIDVFPHASLWSTDIHEMLLVGSMEPPELDAERIAQRMREPGVARALREVGIASPAALFATWITDRAGLERYAANALPVTDDRPRIEYGAWIRSGEFERVLPELLAARTAPPLTNADADMVAATDAERERLYTFYSAGLHARAGRRAAWARDIERLVREDIDNPYFHWFTGGAR